MTTRTAWVGAQLDFDEEPDADRRRDAGRESESIERARGRDDRRIDG
jgi:hypothetical protein